MREGCVDPEKESWLGLSEAAALLGVHPSTLRSWADQGKFPVHRTPGGHRRFRRSDVESWSAPSQRAPAAEVQLLIQNALGRTRLELSEGRMSSLGWYHRLGEEHRQAYRRESRRLLQLLAEVPAQQEGDSLAEADALAADYVKVTKDAGLSLYEAVEAFLFFREFLMESIFSFSQASSIAFGPAWAATRRTISKITNRVLLNLIRMYG